MQGSPAGGRCSLGGEVRMAGAREVPGGGAGVRDRSLARSHPKWELGLLT